MRFKRLWKKKHSPLSASPEKSHSTKSNFWPLPKRNTLFKKWKRVSFPQVAVLSPLSVSASAKGKRLFAFAGRHKAFLFCLFLSLMISDLLLIKSTGFLLPEKDLAFSRPFSARPLIAKPSLNRYEAIWENNIFHTGPIPDILKEEEPESLDPLPTSLPFKLRGTIVHANPKRSVATILAGIGKPAKALKQGEDIVQDQAKIVEIQRAKVIFRNQSNNRLEYILIPKEENPLNIAYEKPAPLSDKTSLIERVGNNFQVKRSDINTYLQKLPELLRQARVVPHRSSTGEIEGWRFASINKDSVWEKHLGFKKGDIIKQVDGETVKNPEQAMDLFERLRQDSSGFKILIEKDGKEMEYEYSVRENVPILM